VRFSSKKRKSCWGRETSENLVVNEDSLAQRGLTHHKLGNFCAGLGRYYEPNAILTPTPLHFVERGEKAEIRIILITMKQ
jgi:hypothetical protein